MVRKREPSLSELAAALESDAQAASNNVPAIIGQLHTCDDEADLRCAVKALRAFFSKAYDQGMLSSKERRKAAPGNKAPATVYREWLHRQHGAFVRALVGLLQRPGVGARAQSDAVLGAMDAVRGPNPGEFDTAAFDPLLRALLTSRHVSARVLGGFISRFLGYADVRLYALRCAAKLCAARAEARGSSNGGATAAAAQDEDEDDGDNCGGGDNGAAGRAKRARRAAAAGAADGGDSDGEDDGGVGAGAGAGGSSSDGPWEAAGSDVVRNVYDLLSAVDPDFGADATADTTKALAAALGAAINSSGGKAGAGAGAIDPCLLTSWTGVAEAGIAAASTAGTGERSKDRRKRQREGGGAGGGQQQQQQQGTVSVRWANAQVQRRAFSAAWLALLGMELPDDVYRKVLLSCHARLVPHLSQPLLLADFLSWALRKGGLLGMLALNSLFVLVTKHGLEYPRFYEQLYSLLTPEAFRAKYRARFFQLADIFLASPAVPAYTAAAFAKRFARMALGAPPAGAMVALAFIHNILRRHPPCAVLLDRPVAASASASASSAAAAGGMGAGGGDDDDGEFMGDGGSGSDGDDGGPSGSSGSDSEGEGGRHANGNGVNGNGGVNGAAAAPTTTAAAAVAADVYDEGERDPAYSRAIESSLWELEALRRHYSPQVSALAGLLDKDFSDRKRTAEAELAPLLQASYASLVTADLGRKLKPQVATAFYPRPPTRMFDDDQVGADFGGWQLA